MGGGCSLIGVKVVVNRGQGEEDERPRGGSGPEEVQRAEGGGPHLEKARFRGALERTPPPARTARRRPVPALTRVPADVNAAAPRWEAAAGSWADPV